MKSILLVSLLILSGACASRPSPESVRYAIVTPTEVIAREARMNIDHLRALRAASPNDLLWFERDGVQYIVSDAATVARATKAANHLERELNALTRDTASAAALPIIRYDDSYGPPAYQPPPPKPDNDEYMRQRQAEIARSADYQLPRYADFTSEEQFDRRRLQDSVARAERRLRRVIDDALANGLAQPMI